MRSRSSRDRLPVRQFGRQRHPGQPPQDGDDDNRQDHVDHAQRAVADRDGVRPGDRLADSHHVVDDPRLAADLGGDPAGDQRDHRQRARGDHRPAQRPGERAAPEPQVQVDESDQRQQRADPDHCLEGEPHYVDRRLVGERDDVQALDDRVRVVGGEDRQQARDLDPPDDRVPVVPAAQVLGGASCRLRQALHRGQLDRLILSHVPGGPVADDDLQRRRHRRGGHRDAERGALVAAAAAAQERPRVRAAEHEPCHDEGGEVHVHVLAPEHRVGEQRLPGMHVDRPAVVQREPGGVVHPPVDGDDEQRARDARDRDRDAGQEVRLRA
jgi:hypothetical protein